jgi:hypothetical protein
LYFIRQYHEQSRYSAVSCWRGGFLILCMYPFKSDLEPRVCLLCVII